MFTACLVHSRAFLWLNSSAKITELTTSCLSISRTVRTNPVVDNGHVQLRAGINWSPSYLCTPGAYYVICWRSSSLIRLYSHLIPRCFWFFLLLVLCTIFNCASWAMFWWLHLESHSELSGVCVEVGFQRVAYWQKRQSFCWILFHAQLPPLFLEPWFAAVEEKRWS